MFSINNDTAFSKLDNPAWHALNETHSNFALGNNFVKRYQSQIVAFAAFNHNIAKPQFDDVFQLNDSLFIIAGLPLLAKNYVIEKIVEGVQMVCTKKIEIEITANIEKLTANDDEQIMTLVNEVYPGYYKSGTRLMGDYFGIKQNNKLVAMAGERIRMNSFTEISAVITHPSFAGRQFAQQLVTHIVNKNFASGTIPFLHTEQTNERAIKIYNYLGFEYRRNINFSKIKRMK